MINLSCLCVYFGSNRHLLHNSNLSSSNGSTEDLFNDSIDSCEIDITEKGKIHSQYTHFLPEHSTVKTASTMQSILGVSY